MNTHIIGGMFGLENPSESSNQFPPFLKSKEVFTANARSGINLLAKLLRPKTIWMPSFLCDVMLKAVDGFKVRFYEVDTQLSPIHDWLNAIQPGDLVLVIDYFGFQQDNSLLSGISAHGGWIVEDASQALLSSYVGTNSDFVIFSPRKFLAVPDGGILRNNTTVIDLSETSLRSSPHEWWLNALSACVLRREFDLYGGEKKWFPIFKETDAHGPIGPYAMSEFSRTLLENSFDYSSIIRTRRQNYRALNNYLSNIALFPHLPDDVVPLGYPICLPNRDYVRDRLFENQIYPPVHWPISGIVPETFQGSHKLASMILTLVCDQRYVEDDMKKTANIVLRAATL